MSEHTFAFSVITCEKDGQIYSYVILGQDLFKGNGNFIAVDMQEDATVAFQ